MATVAQPPPNPSGAVNTLGAGVCTVCRVSDGGRGGFTDDASTGGCAGDLGVGVGGVVVVGGGGSGGAAGSAGSPGNTLAGLATGVSCVGCADAGGGVVDDDGGCWQDHVAPAMVAVVSGFPSSCSLLPEPSFTLNKIVVDASFANTGGGAKSSV